MNWFSQQGYSTITIVKGESHIANMRGSGDTNFISNDSNIASVLTNERTLTLTGINEGITSIENSNGRFYIYVIDRPKLILENKYVNLFDYINNGHSGDTAWGCDYVMGICPIGYVPEIISAPEGSDYYGRITLFDIGTSNNSNPTIPMMTMLSNGNWDFQHTAYYNFAIVATRRYFGTCPKEELVEIGLFANDDLNNPIETYTIKIKPDLSLNR